MKVKTMYRGSTVSKMSNCRSSIPITGTQRFSARQFCRVLNTDIKQLALDAVYELVWTEFQAHLPSSKHQSQSQITQ